MGSLGRGGSNPSARVAHNSCSEVTTTSTSTLPTATLASARAPEAAWHRRARRARTQARVLLAVAAVGARLCSHHSFDLTEVDDGMQPWVRVEHGRGKGKGKKGGGQPRIPLRDYYFPSVSSVLPPWQLPRVNVGNPKWYCALCGEPHHNASLQACRTCGAPRGRTGHGKGKGKLSDDKAKQKDKQREKNEAAQGMPKQLLEFARLTGVVEPPDQPMADADGEPTQDATAEQTLKNRKQLAEARRVLLALGFDDAAAEVAPRMADLQPQGPGPKRVYEQAVRHRTVCAEALEKATAEVLKAETALATARAAAAKAATEEHQAKDLVQKAADAYRKTLPGPEDGDDMDGAAGGAFPQARAALPAAAACKAEQTSALRELRLKLRDAPDTVVQNAKEAHESYCVAKRAQAEEPLGFELWHMRELNIVMMKVLVGESDGDSTGVAPALPRGRSPSRSARRSRTPPGGRIPAA